MDYKLHLMNDRKIIFSVDVVRTNVTDAWHKLLDALIEDIPNYTSEVVSTNEIAKAHMLEVATKAKANVTPLLSAMSSFIVGNPLMGNHHYSVVVHSTT